jgi:hypothetical protein
VAAKTYTDIFPALSPDGWRKISSDGALIGTGTRHSAPPTEEQHHE